MSITKLTGLKYFSQKAIEWAKKKLGTSTVATIGSDGCLLCVVATVLNYFGKDTTPDRLNDDITRVKGWYKACRLIYGSISDIYPDISVDWNNYIECADVGAPLDKIDAILKSKRIPIVKVDYTPGGSVNEHWVGIIGKEDGNYLIVDPIDGSEQWFQNRYGDPARYIFKIVVYNGTPKEEENVEDKLSDCQTKVKSLTEEIAKIRLELNNERDARQDSDRDNRDLSNQLLEARKERNTAIAEQKLLEKQIEDFVSEGKGLEDDIKVLGDTVDELRTKLTSSLCVKKSEYSFWQWIKLYFTKKAR